jgi:3-hydroxyacyl-[acyl-carrier-protein] dehydratase
MNFEALDLPAIVAEMPRRHPTVLIDRLLAFEHGKSMRAVKCVTMNEPFFQGHFPGYPIMPGVLVIEALMQLSGILAHCSGMSDPGRGARLEFAGIRGVKFKRQVGPGDLLMLEVEVAGDFPAAGLFLARALVDDEIVTEAELVVAPIGDAEIPQVPTVGV